jgi:hypothetical protein
LSNDPVHLPCNHRHRYERLVDPVKRFFVLGTALLIFAMLSAASSSGGQAKVRIACLHHGRFIYEVRPKQCAFFSRITWKANQGRLVRDISTQGLRWRSWGTGTARATGKDGVATPLRIVAYHRVRCRDGIDYYTLVHIVRPSGRSYRMKLAKCGEVRFQPPTS